MTTAMDIKGIGEALLVTVPHGDWGEIEPSLLDAIDERADFFRGAHLVLQLHERGLGASELGTLRDELAARDIGLSAILSSSALTQEASADLGLASELPRTEAEESELAPIATDLIGDDAALIHRTLRSGQTIRHPGHLVVIGDVNPGAEIIAGGVEHPDRFILPTVLTGASAGLCISREETFGPVVCVTRVASDHEAVKQANSTPFGLGAVVFGEDVERAGSVARRLTAGMVGINRGCHGARGTPWVGARESGFGFHKGKDGQGC